MRRISQFLVAFVAFGLIGCGGDGTSVQPVPEPQPQPQPQPQPVPDAREVEPFDLTAAAYLGGFLLAHENPPPECIDWCESWDPRYDLYHLTVGSSDALRVNRLEGGDTLAGDFVATRDHRFAAYTTNLGGNVGIFLYDMMAGEVRPVAVYDGDDRVYGPKLADDRVLLWQLNDARTREDAFVGSLDGSVEAARVETVLDQSYASWSATLTPDGTRVVWYEENQERERLFAMASVDSPGTPQVLQALEPETTEYWRYGIEYVTSDALMYYELRDTVPRRTYWRLPLDEPTAVASIDIPVPDDHELGPCKFEHANSEPVRFLCRSVRRSGMDFFGHLIAGNVSSPGDAVVLTDAETELFYGFDYSPDGEWVAFAEGSPWHESDTFTVHLADMSGPAPAITTFPTSPHPSWSPFIRPPVVFSPDSTRFVFITEDGLSMVDLQAATLSATPLISITEDMQIERFEMLPDNAHLLLYGAKRNWILPMTEGAMMVPLIPEPPTENWEEDRFLPTP